MASENVAARKQLSAEQERRRCSERSRAKQGERRRMELERKSDDVHALRYRQASISRFFALLCFAVDVGICAANLLFLVVCFT